MEDFYGRRPVKAATICRVLLEKNQVLIVIHSEVGNVHPVRHPFRGNYFQDRVDYVSLYNECVPSVRDLS